MDGTEIRILLVAPVRIHQEGLARLLHAEPGFRLAATAVDATAAALLLAESDVDVVLLDLTADPDPGVARPDRLHALTRVTAAPVVVLGIPGRPDDVVAWAEAGIAGYTTRDGGFDELAGAVRSAASGEFRCQAQVTAGLVRRLAVLAKDRQPVLAVPLTPRELEIAALLARGCSNKEIGQRLHIQLATVKNHVHNILEKLGARRRGEAVATLRRHQLV